MVNYKSCQARPPFSVGLSLQDICNKFGIEPKKPIEEPKVEEPKIEEPQVEEVAPKEEVVVEPSVAPEPVVETAVEEPVAEETPVSEEVATVIPLSELNITAKQIKQLEANGINSIEDLLAFEGDLEALPKIGRAAKQAVMEALTKWQNEQNPTSSTEIN